LYSYKKDLKRSLISFCKYCRFTDRHDRFRLIHSFKRKQCHRGSPGFTVEPPLLVLLQFQAPATLHATFLGRTIGATSADSENSSAGSGWGQRELGSLIPATFCRVSDVSRCFRFRPVSPTSAAARPAVSPVNFRELIYCSARTALTSVIKPKKQRKN